MFIKVHELQKIYLAYYDEIPLTRLSRALGTYPQRLQYYKSKYACRTLADLIINLIVNEGLVIIYE